MPAIVTGLNARIRDHSMSVPVPENTIRHGVPNACNLCHQGKDAEWTLRHMNEWYGDKSREKLILRADAFVQARENNSAAIPALLQILSDPSAGAWIRANAAGYLGNFPNDPSAFNAVLDSFSDPQPLVRATAVSALRPKAAQREAVALATVPLLRDAVRTVRMSAAIALVAMGVQKFPGEDGERFEQAKQLYRARAEFNSDDAQQQLAAGKFFFLSGEMDSAIAAFRASMKLDPGIPAQYYLARSLAETGDYPSARRILGNIPRADPQYTSAQQLLAEIQAKEQSSGDSQTQSTADGNAQVRFLNGQVLFQNEYYGAALKELEQALQLSPKADWATKAEAYRAICLEKLARTREAETAMRELSEKPDQRKDVDLQLAMVELLYETGRFDEALKQIDTTIAAVPEAPTAHFWRSKVLLELHHVDEAGIAAEEAIRLRPELPPAHNLLLRIYLMQGRTKEAAEQTQWLRDYQRRMESR